MRDRFAFAAWMVPAIYGAAAIGGGILLPRIEHRLWPEVTSGISVASATAIYATVASGTMTLSAIVLSLTFVMTQFSATAYSPRLVLWLAEDPLISHALGVFTATFLYAIAALAWVDRDNDRGVPLLSAAVVVLCLVASIGTFIALVKRVTLLQVNRMLTFTGDQGRRVIAAVYRDGRTDTPESAAPEAAAGPPTQMLAHRGRPQAIQAIDGAALVTLARGADARIDVTVAVGDTVIESTPLLRVYGGTRPIDEQALRTSITLGHQRTFEQDPQYAVRLLVDIAIRALSPAVNDPTTAVQALDEIGDLLLRLARSRLTTAPMRDADGIVRVVVPLPTWDDFLRLAFDEICAYGATSAQVMRRMNALVRDLRAAVPAARRGALDHWRNRLHSSIDRHFSDADERREAGASDRQGFGVSTRPAA